MRRLKSASLSLSSSHLHGSSLPNTKHLSKGKMSNKRRVVIALYHRGGLSLGDNRQRLGYESYHWGILIMPKHPPEGHCLPPCSAYNATDNIVIDPETHEDLNPNLDWLFRTQHGIDPSARGQLIGRIIVGKLPNHVSTSDLDTLLAGVPLPSKDASPPQSCVTWTLAALGALQNAGLVWNFDIETFRDWALAYGDRCMIDMSLSNVREYKGVESNSNKRRLIVTLHHRDEYSLPPHRELLCHEAYHWGILIMPKMGQGAIRSAYDVSDASDIDPETRQLRNTNLEWQFRAKNAVDPARSGSLLARIVIGKIPNDVPDSRVEAILRQIPLPVKHVNPPENCVTWTLNAVVALQEAGLA